MDRLRRDGWSSILHGAREGLIPSREETRQILTLVEEDAVEAVFETARELRRRHFGDRVFLYGFIYFSTYCRNDCSFCFYRRSNPACSRYRKDPAQVLEAAKGLADTGVHLIDLTTGEDPAVLGRDGGALADLVRAVREATGLPVMVSPGVVPDRALGVLSRAGTSWYACYQETHRRDLFAALRPGQDYDTRFRTKQGAHELGLLVEEGILVGVGEGPSDVADSLEVMGYLDADQVRVMGFVPQPGTPMADLPLGDRKRELLTIAALRLRFPDRLIPASLDVDGIGGLEARLRAGANVVTSLIPPSRGLGGVARAALDIEDARRTVSGIRPVLAACGLEPAPRSEYRDWMERRRRIVAANRRESAACGSG